MGTTPERMRAMPDESAVAEPLRVEIGENADLRLIRRYLFWIFLILMFTAVYFARDVLLPVVLGVVIALTISPVTRSLSRFGVPAPVSAGLVMVVLGGALVAAGYGLSGPMQTLIEESPRMGAEIRFKLRDLIAQLAVMQELGSNLGEVASVGSEDVQTVVMGQPGLISETATSVASAGSSIVAAFFLAIFLLASGDFFHRRMVEAVPTLTDKKRALTIVRDIERQISRYLAAVTAINAGMGVAVGLAFWALGMPYPHLWGVAAFLLNFLPFIGSALGIVLAVGVAIITFPTLSQAMLVPLVYLGLTTVEGQVVTPMLVGRHLDMNIVAIFLTVILWVWLWGVPGAFLAVPFLVVIKVISDNLEGMRGLGLFLGTGAAE